MKSILLLLVLFGTSAFAQTEGRWEYAMLLDISFQVRHGKHVGTASICYAQPAGCRMEPVEIQLSADQLKVPIQLEVIAKAIQRLGQNGYELVSKATMQPDDQEVLFFKRWRK